MKKRQIMKMLKESLKVLTPEAYDNKENFFKAFNQYAESCGIPTINVSDMTVNVPNKSLPTFDTLDFDDISTNLSDLNIIDGESD